MRGHRAIRLLVSLYVVLVCFSILARADDLSFEKSRAKSILSVVDHEIHNHFYDEGLKGLPWDDLLAQTRTRIDKAQTRADVYVAIYWLVNKLGDSHTRFIPPPYSNWAEFGFRAKPFGDEVRVYSLVPGGAAEKAGLKAGDKILSINNVAAERSTYDFLSFYFQSLHPVSALTISVQRGNDPPTNITIQGVIREGIVGYRQYIKELQHSLDPFRYSRTSDGIAYVYLPNFLAPPSTFRSLAKHIEGAKGLVIDVRGDPGGALEAVVFFAGFFQKSSSVMATNAGRGKSKPIDIEPEQPNFSGPIAVLVDSESSSASEAIARYFQVTKRATIVGDNTLGRLTISQFFEDNISGVPYGVQIAVARMVFPQGDEVEGKGVTPDFLCLPGWDDLQHHRDPCRAQAVSIVRQALQLPDTQPEDSDAKDVPVN